MSDKIEPLAKNIYCLRSGNSAHTQAIARYVRYFLNAHTIEKGELPSVLTAATMVKNMIYTNKKFLEAAVIVGGFDPVKGGQIYQVPLGGFLINENLAIGGSGSGYISSYCDMHYKPNMTQDQCREFLVSAVSLAMYRDSSSGGVVRILNITKDGASREYFSHNQLPIK